MIERLLKKWRETQLGLIKKKQRQEEEASIHAAENIIYEQELAFCNFASIEINSVPSSKLLNDDR
jgi:hypothetical protein